MLQAHVESLQGGILKTGIKENEIEIFSRLSEFFFKLRFITSKDCSPPLLIPLLVGK
jgi:hypothetical protein